MRNEEFQARGGPQRVCRLLAPQSLILNNLQVLTSDLSGRFRTNMLGNSRAESEQKVRSWGFAHAFTWTDGP
jgi:hypothetical protein